MKGQQEGIWGRAVLFPDCGDDCTIYCICQNPQNCTTTIKYILLFVIKKKNLPKGTNLSVTLLYLSTHHGFLLCPGWTVELMVGGSTAFWCLKGEA